MKVVATAGIACLLALAGCGSSEEGPEGPDIGKAKTFELVGLEDTPAVRAGKPTTLQFHIEQPEGGPLTRYKTGSGPHTGVHVIMVRKDLSEIVHRHPPVDKGGTVTDEVAFPEAGPWHVVADVYPDLGANTLQNFQLTGEVQVDGDYAPRPLPAFAGEQVAGGNRFAMRAPAKLRSLKPQFLDITVTDAKGRPAEFDQYYGALAHAIFFRKGSLAYFHTHVCGAGASGCASSIGGSSITGRSSTPGKLRVGMLLPSAGTWKLFLQSRIAGKVVTVPYTLKVSLTPRRALGWLAFVAALELVTRAVVYGMAPSAGESSRALAGHLGGPGFVAVLLVAVGLGALLSVGLVLLATMGVRERWALADRRLSGPPPRIAPRPMLIRALLLTLVGWFTFAGIETLIHYREGLGFHGLECLVGPVHRNALPVVAGIALLASALLSVAALVLAWMRRRVGRLVAPRPVPRTRPALSLFSFVTVARRSPLVRGSPPRGPPLVAV